MKNWIIAAVVLIVIIIGGYFAYKAFMSESAGDSAAQAAAAAGTDAPADQVQAQEVKTGEGAEAVPGATVSVLYVGQLQDGTVFDSSAAHGNEPLTFVLGEQGMIPGFQIGVNGMREGGERLLAIPPALAYGAAGVTDESGKVIIPPNATIIFDVQLVKVVPPAAGTAQ